MRNKQQKLVRFGPGVGSKIEHYSRRYGRFRAAAEVNVVRVDALPTGGTTDMLTLLMLDKDARVTVPAAGYIPDTHRPWRDREHCNPNYQLVLVEGNGLRFRRALSWG